ncbi:MAG: hypothetical protein ACI8QD_002019 [Cyclobacteriaceae bacterium]|jgi:hypothetical protein
MARPSKKLISALQVVSSKLRNDSTYQWGHMGACNCGNLAQELTSLSKGEIHEYAMRGRGDWSEQVDSFCPTSAFPMDLLISELIGHGLSLEDLIHLERLTDQEVLTHIPLPVRHNLQHNQKEDVATYMEAWAFLLSEKMPEPEKVAVIA